MFKIAALVSGGGTNLQAILDVIDAGKIKGAKVEVVISTNDHAYALERAKKHGIKTMVLRKKDFANSSDREQVLLDELSLCAIDLVVTCGCMMVLSEDFVNASPAPIINVHPSLLPKYGGKGFYGLAPHKAVLAAGETMTGATVHYVDGGIDTGGIILQQEVKVFEYDTPETLQKRVMEEAEWQILPAVIAKIVENHSRKN